MGLCFPRKGLRAEPGRGGRRADWALCWVWLEAFFVPKKGDRTVVWASSPRLKIREPTGILPNSDLLVFCWGHWICLVNIQQMQWEWGSLLGVQQGSGARGPSPWLVSTQHGGGQCFQPSTSCITPSFPPTQGPKGTSGKPGKPGEAGLPGLPGVDVSVPSYCIPTSSHPCLSQPSSGSDFHCCSAAGLIQAGNLVLTEVTVVPSGVPGLHPRRCQLLAGTEDLSALTDGEQVPIVRVPAPCCPHGFLQSLMDNGVLKALALGPSSRAGSEDRAADLLV